MRYAPHSGMLLLTSVAPEAVGGPAARRVGGVVKDKAAGAAGRPARAAGRAGPGVQVRRWVSRASMSTGWLVSARARGRVVSDRQTVLPGPTPATPTTFSVTLLSRRSIHTSQLITAVIAAYLFRARMRLTCVPRLTVRSEVTTPHPPRLRPQRAGLTGLSVVAVVVSRRHR